MNYTFDTATVISLIVSVIIPAVAALVANEKWPGELIGITTLALAFANGFLTQWQDAGNGFDWRAALVSTVFSFVVAVLSHHGIWKGTQTEAKLLQFPPRPSPTPAVQDQVAS